jgi:hypothetical protein
MKEDVKNCTNEMNGGYKKDSKSKKMPFHS